MYRSLLGLLLLPIRSTTITTMFCTIACYSCDYCCHFCLYCCCHCYARICDEGEGYILLTLFLLVLLLIVLPLSVSLLIVLVVLAAAGVIPATTMTSSIFVTSVIFISEEHAVGPQFFCQVRVHKPFICFLLV